MKCEQVAELLEQFVLPNCCSECEGDSFLRKISVYERRGRVVDILHCLGCGKTYRVGDGMSCEGLDPSGAVRVNMMEGMRQFKSVDDIVGGGSFGFNESDACSGAR